MTTHKGWNHHHHNETIPPQKISHRNRSNHRNENMPPGTEKESYLCEVSWPNCFTMKFVLDWTTNHSCVRLDDKPFTCAMWMMDDKPFMCTIWMMDDKPFMCAVWMMDDNQDGLRWRNVDGNEGHLPRGIPNLSSETHRISERKARCPFVKETYSGLGCGLNRRNTYGTRYRTSQGTIMAQTGAVLGVGLTTYLTWGESKLAHYSQQSSNQ